jgi:hypothetical protein
MSLPIIWAEWRTLHDTGGDRGKIQFDKGARQADQGKSDQKIAAYVAKQSAETISWIALFIRQQNI